MHGAYPIMVIVQCQVGYGAKLVFICLHRARVEQSNIESRIFQQIFRSSSVIRPQAESTDASSVPIADIISDLGLISVFDLVMRFLIGHVHYY
jgi:hypothetical protein